MTQKTLPNWLYSDRNDRDVYRETLYRVNVDTGKQTRLLGLKGWESFVYLDAETAIAAVDKSLRVYDITGKRAVLIGNIPTTHEIVRWENKTDHAGDWLFLYGYNKATGRNELLEKVRFA